MRSPPSTTGCGKKDAATSWSVTAAGAPASRPWADFRIDPSQGTHFFQNLTSFNVGFVHVDPFARREDEFDSSALDALPAAEETKYWRLIHLDEPLKICIDGRSGRAFMSVK